MVQPPVQQRRPASGPTPAAAKPAAAARRRGRPRGSQTRLLHPRGGGLGRHHFAFLRALLDGVDLEAAWRRYLAFTGGPQDQRHFSSRLRQLVAALEHGGRHRGCRSAADQVVPVLRALPGPARRARGAGAGKAGRVGQVDVAAARPQIPSLAAWRAGHCGASGIDEDFYTEAEWVELYRDEFGPAPADPVSGAGKAGHFAAPPTPALPATAHARWADEVPLDRVGLSAGERRTVLAALADLERSLAREVSLADEVGYWLVDGVTRALARVGVLTLGDLVDFVNLNGHRWHRRAAGLGAVQAQRLMAWLTPLAAAQGRPIKDSARLPETDRVLLRRDGFVTAPPGRFPRLLPAGDPVDGSAPSRDAMAVTRWLAGRRGPTLRDYHRVAERFLLWCSLERRTTLTRLGDADVVAYRTFIASPPADWVQQRKLRRDDPDWRPFHGPLRTSSQRHEFAVLGSLFAALADQGHVQRNPMVRLGARLGLPAPQLDPGRSLDEAQWDFALRMLQEKPDTSQRRRLQLVLELAGTTGLRLSELASARMGDLRLEQADGGSAWLLDVGGSGSRVRTVVILDHVKSLIDQHLRDRAAAGLEVDEAISGPRDRRPLIGILRRPPPRRRLDRLGVPFVDRSVPTQADPHGALEHSALYKLLRRFFSGVADQAAASPGAPDPGVFLSASTHWLRHTFASRAVRCMPPPVVQRLLGTADLRLVSAHANAETADLVRGTRALRPGAAPTSTPEAGPH